MSDDIKMLQRHFDREWDAEKEDRDRKLHAAAARKAEEEAELRKRRLLERQRAEEVGIKQEYLGKPNAYFSFGSGPALGVGPQTGCTNTTRSG